MNDESQCRKVFIDFLPNQPQTDQDRENFRGILRQGLEGRLEDSIARMWVLPQLAVKPDGEYLALLLESRELYVEGRFYSCVAMCGIVGERLVKDVLRSSVLIQKHGAATAPSEKALDQFERVKSTGSLVFSKKLRFSVMRPQKPLEISVHCVTPIHMRAEKTHSRTPSKQSSCCTLSSRALSRSSKILKSKMVFWCRRMPPQSKSNRARHKQPKNFMLRG